MCGQDNGFEEAQVCRRDMFPPGHRRHFLKGAAGWSAVPSLAQMAGAGATAHRAMVVWLAHSFISPFARGRAFDRGVISEILNNRRIDEKYLADIFARCADHGFNTVYIA